MNGRFYRCVDSMLLLFPNFGRGAVSGLCSFIIPHRTWSTAPAPPWVEGDIALTGDRMVAIGDSALRSAMN